MNRVEKEQYVIRLYKENKSTREIAKLMQMSFRDIGAITNRVRDQREEDDDIKSKSKITQAIALFSELKTPVEVVIALDLPAAQVQTIYQEYWKLNGMYNLAQIYEAKYDLHELLVLHRIVKGLGMEKQDVINVLDFVKYNQLQTLHREAERLRSEINMLETEKTEAMGQIFRLKRMIPELEETSQKRAEMEPGLYQRFINYNTDKLCPIAQSEPDTNPDSNGIVSYTKE